MCVIQAAERAVAIWFTEENAPPLEKILRLVRGALAAGGREPWPAIAAECFTAGDETLVIARPGQKSRPSSP